MKLIIKREQLTQTPQDFLRRAGYGLIFDRQRGINSFVRRLGGGFYPRLHMYPEIQGDNIVFNLHMDQKQASYEGSHMHNAEYDNEIVAEEIERLRSIINGNPFA